MAESIAIKILWTWLVLHIADVTSTVNPQRSSAIVEPRGYYRDRDEYSSDRNLPRCTSCGYTSDRRGDYDSDRYYDYYYYNYRQRYPTRGGYEDRNWYYQPDSRYEDRQRYSDRDYGYDDRGGYNSNNRNRDMYDTRYGYDNYRGNDYRGSDYRGSDNRGSDYRGSDYRGNGYRGNDYRGNDYRGNDYRGNDNRGSDYRGNGYDNRDPYYRGSMRDDQYYNRDRDRYNDQGGSSRYPSPDRDRDRDYYGRPQYYDNRNFKPWDETYRGVSGFDSSSGHGYYFANKPPTQSSLPPRPYLPTQNSLNRTQNDGGSTTVSPSSLPSSSSSHSSSSASGKPGDRGYAPQSEYYRDQSPSYGSGGRGGTRPLETSYLFDRDTNRSTDSDKVIGGIISSTPEPEKNDTNDSSNNNKPEENRQ